MKREKEGGRGRGKEKKMIKRRKESEEPGSFCPQTSTLPDT